MSSFSVSALATRFGTRQWTCSTCRSQLTRSKPSGYLQVKGFASGRGSSHGSSGGSWNNGRRQGPRKAVLYASSGTAAAGVGALAFTDDIKNGYEAAERTGRVFVGLMVCINEYGYAPPFFTSPD